VENQHTGFDAPTAANVTVMAKRPREYLKEPEIERLMDAARDLDLAHGRLHVRRSKGGETAALYVGKGAC